jgi:hypothetical protein
MNHAPAVQVKNIKNAALSIEPRLSADAYICMADEYDLTGPNPWLRTRKGCAFGRSAKRIALDRPYGLPQK